MTGFKKTLRPKFNIENESNFIVDFFPSVKNEDWKYTNLKKFIPESISVQPFKTIENQNTLINLNKFYKNQSVPKKMWFFL